MTKIAILGSNGQVGAEVAAYLSLRADVDLICLVRSPYSAALFRVLSIPYATFEPSSPDALAGLLSDCDMVVDCTYPNVQLPRIAETIQRQIRAVVQSMRRGSSYVYMSSIMAFGMPNDARFVADHTWCRTSYSSIKRSAEKYARRAGRKHNVLVFNLRLGQVHGLLQGVTLEFKTSLEECSLAVQGNRSDLTISVFAYSVSQAILRCANGSVQPGLYTVVSSPQWTLGELYDYYTGRHQARARVRFVEAKEPSAIRDAGAAIGRALVAKRDLLETYVLLRFPSLFAPTKGIYRKRAAASEIGLLGQNREKAVSHLLGLVPGPCITDIGSSAEEITQAEVRLADILDDAIARNRA